MSTLAGRRMHGPGVRWIAATVLVIVAAAQPAIRTVEWVRGISKVSTRAQAYAWLLENIPPGAKVAIETRNLVLPPDRFNSVNEPRLITRDLASYVDEGFQYFVASSDAFGQSLYGRRGDATTIAYRQFFRQLELVTSFNPSADHPGPELRIYRVIS